MPSTPILSVAQLKLFPDQDRSTLLATSPEDQWLERKSGQVQSRDVANVMIGMANAEGGIIVIGVTDAGVIEGVAAGDQNAWRRASPDFTVPPVRHHYSVFPCLTAKGTAGELVVIEIEASETVHQNVRGDVYLRVGDSTRQLRPFEAQELQYDKGQSVFDARPVPEATMDDLDPSLLERYMRRVRARAAAIEVLDARGLALRSGEQQVPTVAGIAVLGRNPQRFFPEAFVRVVEYRDANAPSAAARTCSTTGASKDHSRTRLTARGDTSSAAV